MSEQGIQDQCIGHIDALLRKVFFPVKPVPSRANPANGISEAKLSFKEKQHIAGLMRVNHAGEVCAQGLYQGQAVTANLQSVKEQMQQAAIEELDHLAWCEQRLAELNASPSVLTGFWYASSWLLGAFAGLAGDKWSLGFVAETEKQVGAHLQKHLASIPLADKKTAKILQVMQADEAEHALVATAAGAAVLPWFVQRLMAIVSKGMTVSSYYI